MAEARTTLVASGVVVATGVLWGVYWLPVRSLTDAGLSGAWGSFAIVAAASLALAPFGVRYRGRLARAGPLAVFWVALGGFAFVLYSVAFVYGRVAMVILLFFLTPVWSTLIGRFVMGWPTPRLRFLAMIVGLAGLAVMLGADGEVPLPRGPGEWLAVASGLLWSVATTGIRGRPALAAPEATFVFAVGACAGALPLAMLLGATPRLSLAEGLPTLAIAAATGALWWGISMMALLWAAARLEPARLGILLMTEVVVGATSAAWLADESLGRLEVVGGALVLCAGILELWPPRPGPGPAVGRPPAS